MNRYSKGERVRVYVPRLGHVDGTVIGTPGPGDRFYAVEFPLNDGAELRAFYEWELRRSWARAIREAAAAAAAPAAAGAAGAAAWLLLEALAP